MPRSGRVDDLLVVVETLLKAQLKAIEELRRQEDVSAPVALKGADASKRRSQTDLAYEVLARAGEPLHILEIVKRIQSDFGLPVSRDSLISAVLKKVARRQQFVKTGKNMYGLLGRDERP